MRSLREKAQALGFAALTLYGEYLQHVAKQDPKEYTWLAGHLSDFTSIACFTTLVYPVLKSAADSKSSKYVAIALAPTIYTFSEIVEKFTKGTFNGGTFDIQDILCYWAGSLAAVGLSELVHSEKVEKFTTRLFNKKTLEKQLVQEV